ncbi:hypothetical protein IG631_16715 [Alternaria alternata]|nr:hypothetical protein IG631_16715 [Alternaria alternata]
MGLHAVVRCRRALKRTHKYAQSIAFGCKPAASPSPYSSLPEPCPPPPAHVPMVLCKAPSGATSSHDASSSSIYCPIELTTHIASYDMI